MSATSVELAPRFSVQEALEISREKYGIVGEATQLPSERDQNFRIAAGNGRIYVLKIANAGETESVLELQNEAMRHIRASLTEEQICPQVLQSRDDRQIENVKCEGASFAVRMVSYLPGRPIAQIKPQRRGLYESVGRLLARLNRTLGDFDHPAAHRDFQWDLRLAASVVEENSRLLADEQRMAVEHFLTRYRAWVMPRLGTLRRSVIHGDGNDYNIMAVIAEDWSVRAAGIIDFGDMVYSHTINEVAIAAAYTMLNADDPVTAAGAVVAGYHRELPLTAEEIDIVYDLMCMRLCVSICLAAKQHVAAPENDYLLVSQGPIWQLFSRLTHISPEFARYTIRAACGLVPCPQSESVLAWLVAKATDLVPVVDADLRNRAPLILDLSVGSPMLADDLTPQSAGRVTRQIEDAKAALGVSCAVGRYGEARLWRHASHSVPAGARLAETKTIHLGVDLFVLPGESVFTPLNAEVFEVHDGRKATSSRATVILRHVTDAGHDFFTLYGNLCADVLTYLAPGMKLVAGQPFGSVAHTGADDCLPPHLHVQLITDLMEDGSQIPTEVGPSEAAVWKSICPDPGELLGVSASVALALGRSREELLAARQVLLGRNLSIAYRRPLKIVRGLRQHLYDEEGQAYLDVVNNVCHVGHCHPHVVRAGREQMAVLNTNTRYLHDNLIDYAERLLAKFPSPLDVVFFVCSGSEANELALRLARTYTARHDIIMLDAAYHGNTQSLVDISPYKHSGPGGGGAPEWAHRVLMPDPYRGPYKGYGDATGVAYADHVMECIAQLVDAGRPPAAFIAESVLGCGGQVVLPDGYFKAAFQHVRKAGGVCIADEVQVGFGRVGSVFWGWETQGIAPDIVTTGKPIGNGHPMAAVVTTHEIAAAFANGMEYFNTFGGNPVSCAIGSAVLDVIEEEHLQQNALNAGNRLMDGLRELMDRHPLIGDVRGLGLFVGAELVLDRATLAPAPRHASYIAERMRDHGILISTDGPLHNVLKMKPPLVFTPDDADCLVATLDRVLCDDCLQSA